MKNQSSEGGYLMRRMGGGSKGSPAYRRNLWVKSNQRNTLVGSRRTLHRSYNRS